MKDILELWKSRLGLNSWSINIEPINSEQVMMPDDIGDDDYFIGVSYDHNIHKATIYHDVPLDEASIVHELNHIIFPHVECGPWNDKLVGYLIAIHTEEN